MNHGGMRVGAGRPSWHGKVEQHRKIDVRRWARDGLLVPGWIGQWTWRDPDSLHVDARIAVSVWASHVRLDFAIDQHPVSQVVLLERKACHFGGYRVWFKCPSCTRQVALLYMQGHRFACRNCQELAFESQSEDFIDRTWRRQQKVESKMGAQRARPKGMHRQTYARLLDQVRQCKTERRQEMLGKIARLLALDENDDWCRAR
jgi:hypothetical protein